MVIIALCTGATAWLLDPAIDKIFLDKDESMLLINSNCNHFNIIY